MHLLSKGTMHRRHKWNSQYSAGSAWREMRSHQRNGLIPLKKLKICLRPFEGKCPIPESEFMHFNIENDGSPATIVALFLCRAIAKMYPDAEDARIALRAGSEAVLHGICTGITLMAGKRSLR